MRFCMGLALLIAATNAEASHQWMPVSTRPLGEVAGLYVDRQSIHGPFTARRVWERFVNSYREETLTLVEMNCEKSSLRAIKTISRAPNGTLLKRGSSAGARAKPWKMDSLQHSAKALVCKSVNAKR